MYAERKLITANSIKVVLEKREKVEYECERLVGNDYSFIHETLPFIGFPPSLKLNLAFL